MCPDDWVRRAYRAPIALPSAARVSTEDAGGAPAVFGVATFPETLLRLLSAMLL